MTVYEKSNVFGGRCATRVTRGDANVKFDTGAQYYSLKGVMAKVHARWSDAGITKPWFADAKGTLSIGCR